MTTANSAIAAPHPRKRYRGLGAEERVAARRRRLIEAGIELYGTAGFRATSVKSICLATGLTERYFYESFSNGEDLLCQACAVVMQDLRLKSGAALAAAGEAAPEKILAAALAYFSEIREHPAAARLILHEMEGVSALVDAHYANELAHTTELFVRWFFADSKPKRRNTLQATVLAQGMVGALYQIAKEWMRSEFALPTDVVARHMQALAVGVLASYKGELAS
jgi:AcrR family transcriptional regulator